MLRRQLVFVLLLAGVGYLWWQSRGPSRYSEWAGGGTSDPERTLLDAPFASGDGNTWEFASPGDSVWRISKVTDGLVRYRVLLRSHDSTHWLLYLDTDLGGACRNLAILAPGKSIRVEPHGDSALFFARGAETSRAWIPWAHDAVPYEAIVALGDLWAEAAELPITIVRIQPATEVVTQLPAVLRADSAGAVQVVAAGKELVTLYFDSGHAAKVCLAGGRCLTRREAT